MKKPDPSKCIKLVLKIKNNKTKECETINRKIYKDKKFIGGTKDEQTFAKINKFKDSKKRNKQKIKVQKTLI